MAVALSVLSLPVMEIYWLRPANCVTTHCDPTAHAEVSAIREAAARLGTFDLSGCEIYTSCEPCPMCLGAIYWARLDKIYYANNREDAARAGFDDDFIYRELELKPAARHKPSEIIMEQEAKEAFRRWIDKMIRQNIEMAITELAGLYFGW